MSELDTKYGVHPNMITQWKQQAIEGMADVFSGKAGVSVPAGNHGLNNQQGVELEVEQHDGY